MSYFEITHVHVCIQTNTLPRLQFNFKSNINLYYPVNSTDHDIAKSHIIYFYQTYSGAWNCKAVCLNSNVKNSDRITI